MVAITKTWSSMANILRMALLFIASCLFAMPAVASGLTGQAPDSLKTARIPIVPGLLNGSSPIVTDPKMAIALGKALFWDSNVGSDQIACASCHFYAGVDGRIRNQLGRAQQSETDATLRAFGAMASGRAGGVNYTPSPRDFPFTQFIDPRDNTSELKVQTAAVLGSAGSFQRTFLGAAIHGEWESCAPVADSFFQSGGALFRQVGQRNAPNVINAVFNFRDFWDGRANNVFNGVSPWGARDLRAGIWVDDPDRGLVKKRLLLSNAALASQAVAPIVNKEEMACEGRALRDVARRVLSLQPLSTQTIAESDSVLGRLRSSSGIGLSVDYPSMIRKAFSKRFWSSDGVPEGASSQLEANFPFFYGLAIQLYEATLVSDQAPVDSSKDREGYPRALSPEQRRGQDIFVSRLCIACHAGPTFTLAAHPEVVLHKKNPNGAQLIDRMVVNGSVPGVGQKDSVTFILFDRGFANTSVVPAGFDLGLAGFDPFGYPFSYSRQYLDLLEGIRGTMIDPVKIYACDFLNPFVMDYLPEELMDDPSVTSASKCRKARAYAKVPKAAALISEEAKPGAGRALSMINGAFKIPSLRNIELTGPYMHTGGMKSLEEVVDFYDRGGNVMNQEHFATLVLKLNLTDQQKSDLIAYLHALTDERVRWEKAPFDHPSLMVPEGGDSGGTEMGTNLARDRTMLVPAVGREGRSQVLGPLVPYDQRLQKMQP